MGPQSPFRTKTPEGPSVGGRQPALNTKNNARGVTASLAGVLIGAGVLFWLFQQITLQQVGNLLLNAYAPAVWTFLVLSLAMTFVRTWRYSILLRFSGHRVSGIALFLVVLVRNLFSDLLPARIGSAIYIFLLTTRLGVPLGASTSSFAAAFMLDLLGLAPLVLVAAVFSGGIGALSGAHLVAAALTIGGLAAAMILLAPALLDRLRRILRRPSDPAGSWRKKAADIVDEVETDLEKLRTAGLFVPVFLLSIAVRLLKYLALFAFLYALLHPQGYEWHELHIPRILIALCAAELAASLPISGIAAIGIYEGTWTFVFSLLGFPLEVAALTAVSHHAFTQLYALVTGGAALIVLLTLPPRFSRPGLTISR